MHYLKLMVLMRQKRVRTAHPATLSVVWPRVCLRKTPRVRARAPAKVMKVGRHTSSFRSHPVGRSLNATA